MQGNIPKESFVDFWVNPPKEAMKMYKEFKVISEDKETNTTVIYMRLAMPMMSDRDMAMKISS